MKQFFKVTRTVLDWFQDSSKTSSGINFIPTFLATFFATFFATLFATFFADFFGPAFCYSFLSTQYKRRTIFLSMKYKILLSFLGGGVEVSLRTAAVKKVTLTSSLFSSRRCSRN